MLVVCSHRERRLQGGILTRGARAVCRILYDYDASPEVISVEFRRTVAYIERVIQNNVSTRDVIGDDYKYLDAQTKALYPERVRSDQAFIKFEC